MPVAQHMAALRLGNRHRLRHADLRKRIAAKPREKGRDHAARVIESPNGYRGLRVELLLTAVERIGPTVAGRMLHGIGVNPRAKLGELTTRQRLLLAHHLRGGDVTTDRNGFGRAA